MADPQGLYAKLVEAFKKMGLEVVPGKGAAFDPNVRTPFPQSSTSCPSCCPAAVLMVRNEDTSPL